MINTHLLQVFEAVARAGSVGGAADALGYTQPTVSHHLSNLERQLGTTLFARSRRGVELTERGRLLLNHAEVILAQIDAAERALDDYSSLRVGRLRLGSFASAATTFLPNLIGELRRAHPGLEITLTEVETPEEAVKLVQARALDGVFVYTIPGFWLRPQPGVRSHRALVDPFRVVLPLGHPLADRRSVTVNDLATDRWITARSAQNPCSAALDRAARANGFEPDVVGRVDDYAMAGAAVRAGLGVALVPQLALDQLPQGVVVLPVEDEGVAREIHFVVAQDDAAASAAALLELVGRLGLAC